MDAALEQPMETYYVAAKMVSPISPPALTPAARKIVKRGEEFVYSQVSAYHRLTDPSSFNELILYK